MKHDKKKQWLSIGLLTLGAAALAVFAAAAWLAGQPPGQRLRGQACPARQTDP